MYRYAGCRYPYPHRLTGDGYQILMAGMRLFECAPPKPRTWTNDENALLIEMYRKCKPISYIVDVLGRSASSVMTHKIILQKSRKLEKRHNIRVKRSQQYRAFIQRHFRECGLDYCARHLGLSKKTVQEYARQEGVAQKCRIKLWTEKDKEFLRINYRDKGFEYCAQKLGRSAGATRIKACELSITISRGTYDRHKVA